MTDEQIKALAVHSATRWGSLLDRLAKGLGVDDWAEAVERAVKLHEAKLEIDLDSEMYFLRIRERDEALARVAELEASVQNGRELLESAMTGLDEVHARRAELEEHLRATRSEYLRTARAGGCIAAGIVIAVEDILAAVGSPVSDPLPRTVSAAEAESRLAAALEG